MSGYQKNKDKAFTQESLVPDPGPIEPGKEKTGKPSLIKWAFFLVVIIYFLISYYHVPILTRLGQYLIVEHPPRKTDLIVCLSGGNIERGLAAADAYEKGLGAHIFIAREELPDGYSLLKKKGIDYPESIALMTMLLKKLGVPESALVISDDAAQSTFNEARMVRDLVKERGYRSFILITSPTHSRRALLTFKRVFEDQKVHILVLPSSYSEFRPGDWWKKRRYVREVILEYEKLLFYVLKYFL